MEATAVKSSFELMFASLVCQLCNVRCSLFNKGVYYHYYLIFLIPGNSMSSLHTSDSNFRHDRCGAQESLYP